MTNRLQDYCTIPAGARDIGCSEKTLRGYVRDKLVTTVPVGSFQLLPPDQKHLAREIYERNTRRG